MIACAHGGGGGGDDDEDDIRAKISGLTNRTLK